MQYNPYRVLCALTAMKYDIPRSLSYKSQWLNRPIAPLEPYYLAAGLEERWFWPLFFNRRRDRPPFLTSPAADGILDPFYTTQSHEEPTHRSNSFCSKQQWVVLGQSYYYRYWWAALWRPIALRHIYYWSWKSNW